MENQNVRLAIAFVIGLVVGLGIYWAFDRDAAVAPVANETQNVGTTTVGALADDNGVIIENQAAGRSVKVSQIVLEAPGWIAIRDDVNGKPGPRILGAKLFDKGTNTGTVELLRATESGKSYYAILHTDDGSYKNFDSKLDKALLDDSGNQIMVKFDVGQVSSVSTPNPVNTINPTSSPIPSANPVVNIGGKD